MAADWEAHLDTIMQSVLDNGGRSCINASTIIIGAHGQKLGEALAARLGPIEPLPPEHTEAILAAFPDRLVAEKIDASIDSAVQRGSARDLTQSYRDGPRLREFMGALYLCPTILLCDQLDAPLASTEFPFPFASIVQMPIQEALEKIGPTLTVTLLSEDEELVRSTLQSAHIDRINLGDIPTSQIRWDQPHEGNLFDFLYQRRAIQVA
jgi:acyl-CoA reductase-like NAD-dependent aldehyde dehydrogenase